MGLFVIFEVYEMISILGNACLKRDSVWNGSDQGGAQQFRIDKVIEFLEVKIIGD